MTSGLNRTNATNVDARARESLDDDLLTSLLNRTNATNADVRAGNADTRAREGLDDDLETSSLNRTNATNAETRADNAATAAKRDKLIETLLTLTDPSQKGKFNEFAGGIADEGGLEGGLLNTLYDTLGIGPLPSPPSGGLNKKDQELWDSLVRKTTDKDRSENDRISARIALRRMSNSVYSIRAGDKTGTG